MSGRPNSEGVRKLREEFADFISARKDVSSLEEKIEKDVHYMKERREKMQLHYNAIKRLLAEMDVATPANTGWEGRYFELLAMLSESYIP